MDDIIVAENLTKHYKRVHAVRGVNLTMRRGHIFGPVGLDGTGKATPHSARWSFESHFGTCERSGKPRLGYVQL